MKNFALTFNKLCDSIERINETFTLHIVFVITSFLVTNVLGAYLFLKEFLLATRNLQHSAISGLIFLGIQYSIKIFIAYVGNSTTFEAEDTTRIIANILGSMKFVESSKLDLNFLLIQIQSRNKNLHNIFFTINWSFVQAVIIERELVCNSKNILVSRSRQRWSHI